MNSGSRWTPETRGARALEQMRRHNQARYRAYRDLAHAHQAEYRNLHVRHLDAINTKLGPLPGDDD